MTQKLLMIICASALFASCSSKPKMTDIPDLTKAETAIAVQAPAPWGYGGLNSPKNWEQLAPSYQVCKTGKAQSPINLIWSKPLGSPDLKINYKASAAQVTNTGNTVRINVAPGNFSVIRGEKFELKSISFHSSSEHTLSGNSLPIEIQFAHQNINGQLAMIALFAIEGPRNTLIDTIWSNIPKGKNIEQVLPKNINVAELMPTKYTHYNYMGSLTTPPCIEGVEWNVLNTPITMSRDQILSFRQLYTNNSRPIQKLNKRKVKNY